MAGRLPGAFPTCWPRTHPAPPLNPSGFQMQVTAGHFGRAKFWAHQTDMGWKDVNLQWDEVETNFPPIFWIRRKAGMLNRHITGLRTEPGKMPSSSNVTVPVARQQSGKHPTAIAPCSNLILSNKNWDSSKPSTAPKFFYNKTPSHCLIESSESLSFISLLLELSAPGTELSFALGALQRPLLPQFDLDSI